MNFCEGTIHDPLRCRCFDKYRVEEDELAPDLTEEQREIMQAWGRGRRLVDVTKVTHCGIRVECLILKDGRFVYAELEPSPPLFYRKRRGFGIGRVNPFLRWWFEMNLVGPKYTTHFYTHDGGAVTLRRAVKKAMQRANDLYDELEKEEG